MVAHPFLGSLCNQKKLEFSTSYLFFFFFHLLSSI
jgi:hypothetical protein